MSSPIINAARNLFLAFVLVTALFQSPRAHAVVVGDEQIPDTYQLDGKTLVLNGAGLRTLTVLKIRAYIVALYLPQPMHDPEAILKSPGPKVAVVHYLHSASQDQVQERYRTGEKNNCGHGECDKSLEGDFERLVSAVIPVEPGDTTVFATTPKGLRVSFSGKPFESFGQPALGNLIIKGFIGEHAPTPEFRAAVLGLPPS